jgi:hypothetical protein
MTAEMINKNYHADLQRLLKGVERQTKKNVNNWFRDFPAIATDTLHQLDISPLNRPEVISSIFQMKQWPRQHFESGHFADFAFTLFRSESFFLDLYIWNHQDTSIHDHHFSGAFKIVQGECFHLTYDFFQQDQVLSGMYKGKLTLQEKQYLYPGDVKTIEFTPKFIHQNIHSSNPCLTLCLRTLDHPKIMLNKYFNSGLMFKHEYLKMKEKKMLEGLIHLVQLPAGKRSHSELLGRLSSETLYSCLLNQQPFFSRAPAQFNQAIEAELSRRDKHLLIWVKKVLENQRKTNLALSGMFKIS